MKKLIPVVLLVFGWASGARAAAPATLTSLQAINALSNAEAKRHYPVDFEATVTNFRAPTRNLFVQDGDAAIYLFFAGHLNLAAGDRIRVKGITQPSFRPIVQPDSVTVIGHGPLPQAMPATYNELIKDVFDARLVTVRGVVRSADLIYDKNARSTFIHLLADGQNSGDVDISIDTSDAAPLRGLLDAEVEVTGVESAVFDSKMQQTGVMLHANTPADVKVLKLAAVSPWTLPVTPMETVLAAYRVRDLTSRVRVHGTITYYQPGVAVVLQDGSKSIWISTEMNTPLNIGDVADAYGFPSVRNGFLNLVHGEVQDTNVREPIAPLPASWQSLSISDNIQFGHIYDLVSIEGQVMTEAREDEQDEYVLNSYGHLFTAIYHHANEASPIPLPPMKEIPIGARIRVSGICVELSSNQRNGSVPFEILLRSFDDVELVARPSPLSVRNLTLAVGLLLVLFLTLGIRSWLIERSMRRETAALALIEKKRSLILEDINGTVPLTGILEKIAELVSFMLNGVPCWCETSDGTQLGKAPDESEKQRLIHREILARSGAKLGALFAAFDPATEPDPREADALSTGVRLATLAIETRRLYSDLRHRSEFDLLTGAHNRFSLEKHLDALIEEAHVAGSIFGLIYVDLDGFKQVNDVYGHHIGDLYLQEVARRMKLLLRSNDLLARLGGDEFAVLLPTMHSRCSVEEIARRLERCFDDPLRLEGYTLHCSASFGIALYPENGTNRDSLLICSDAAMYKAKHEKKQLVVAGPAEI
jgi:diguanylate cyclase (GGDEF)-like protein